MYICYISVYMKTLLGLLTASILAVPGFCQCINGFKKLFPDPSVDYSIDFGQAVSMYDNYLAVGVPNSDTLGRQSGIVYLYEKKNDTWLKIASLVASQPVTDLRFGVSVKLSKNYLLASAEANGGQVFIFEKPASGWTSAVGITVLSTPGTESFGTAYSHPVDISDDENTIVIADALKRHNFNPTTIAGSLFIYHKEAATSWSNALTPLEIKATNNVTDFGRAGVYISGNRIITGTPFTTSGYGNVFIYNDPSGTFSNLTLEALLSPPATNNYSAWMDNLVVMEDGIMWATSGEGQLHVMFFEKPADGKWISAEPNYLIDPDGFNYLDLNFIRLATNGTDLYVTSRNAFGTTSLTKIKKGAGGWSTPIRQTIDQKSSIFNRYGLVIAANNYSDIVAGYTPNPYNNTVSNALSVYSKSPNDTWASKSLYSTTMSTRDHAYGSGMAIQGEYLFVSATRDNTMKAGAGKVYIYKKNGTQWNKNSTVIPASTTYTYPNFGSALAASKNFVAIGASKWGPPGRFFIYKNEGGDWTNPQLFQEIEIPNAQNTVVAYGDNVAMNDRWLLIPYGDQASSVDTKVAIYEYNGTSWVYKQSVSTGYFNLFSKFTTVGVAIEGNTFIACGEVFELNEAGSWVNTAQLTPTDPENLRFTYPSFTLVQNGSNFGQAVAIRNNTIFIGAPRQDYQGTWDVGAVYIYKKRSEGTWASSTETLKIIPDIKQGSGLFGASLFATENSVMVGAPVAAFFASNDLNNNTPTNIPGKAMLFEAADEEWNTAYLSKKFTGETSVRDNFGIQVGMDDNNIFIASSTEDEDTGTTSGTVYITDVPLALKPIADQCNYNNAITLSARPAGGTWSGKGVTNNTQGIFDPAIAGAGSHKLTYTPPVGCLSNGKITVKVHAKPLATLAVDEEYTVCPKASISIPLTVKAVPNCSYQWLYREHSDRPFTYLSENSVTMNASLRGEYQVMVYNQTCETLSDTIIIFDESVDIQTKPIGSICGSPPEGILLNAIPTGGTWIGTGVSNNYFFTDNLSEGNYTLNYRYISSRACTYEAQATVKLERLVPPLIKRLGNLCKEGSVELSLGSAADQEAIYIWSREVDDGNHYSELGTGTSVATASPGNYIVSMEKDFCKAVSSPITIDDKFSMPLSPESIKSEVCHDNSFTFNFPSDPTATYEWIYTLDGGRPEILSESSYSLHPTKTGYYSATITKGVCSFTSPAKYIYIHSKDSVFVPNVFTPNNDGMNDTFQIFVLNKDDNQNDNDFQDHAEYTIFNRYGEKIFSAPNNQIWNGADLSNGIYYWTGVYHTCKGEPQAIKGWVHLIKQ